MEINKIDTNRDDMKNLNLIATQNPSEDEKFDQQKSKTEGNIN